MLCYQTMLALPARRAELCTICCTVFVEMESHAAALSFLFHVQYVQNAIKRGQSSTSDS